ncbi:MAG: alpha-amylase family glycosyl hydrolase [Marinilabiliaceae bacterium]|nr:alpha-amylase family glycosyl hydrolase [Marinilabiliaceae bacterium]
MKNNHLLLLLLLTLCFSSCRESLEVLEKTSKVPFNDGITRISDDSLAFVLFAPHKNSVHLIGDFNNWEVSDEFLLKQENDRFWIKIGDLDPNKEYVCQYFIDKTIRVADPYAYKISDPRHDRDIPETIYPNLIQYPTGKTSQIAMTVTTKKNDYPWKVLNFKINDPTNLIIYEILIRDFTDAGSINAVKEKLPYLKKLGINAIELMPFNEFEANDSWGYNPTFYFATDKIYGTDNDYKAFIDECHLNNIAVIMDIVLNHCKRDNPMVRMYIDNAGVITEENPWFNIESNFKNPDVRSWGYDLNFESPNTQAFVDSICAFWMREFKIDGFRFDFTKGFSNTPYPATGNNSWGSAYDAQRINNLKRMYDEMKKRNPNALFICEHLSDNSEEKELANHGMFLWGNLNYNINEMTMGWGEEQGGYGPKGDISWGSYKERGWNSPHLVTYMESHDEERLMYKNIQYGKQISGYDVQQIPVGLQRNAAAAVIFFSIPGPKMIWQFGELGYDISIDYGGRLGKKPPHWEYDDDPDRKALFDVYAKMIEFRKTKPVFSTTDYTIDLKTNFKTIILKTTNEIVVAMANFDVITRTKSVNFSKAGTWIDYFSGDEISIGTSAVDISLEPGEYRLYFSK